MLVFPYTAFLTTSSLYPTGRLYVSFTPPFPFLPSLLMLFDRTNLQVSDTNNSSDNAPWKETETQSGDPFLFQL